MQPRILPVSRVSRRLGEKGLRRQAGLVGQPRRRRSPSKPFFCLGSSSDGESSRRGDNRSRHVEGHPSRWPPAMHTAAAPKPFERCPAPSGFFDGQAGRSHGGGIHPCRRVEPCRPTAGPWALSIAARPARYGQSESTSLLCPGNDEPGRSEFSARSMPRVQSPSMPGWIPTPQSTYIIFTLVSACSRHLCHAPSLHRSSISLHVRHQLQHAFRPPRRPCSVNSRACHCPAGHLGHHPQDGHHHSLPDYRSVWLRPGLLSVFWPD